jgi:hypothetical protein
MTWGGSGAAMPSSTSNAELRIDVNKQMHVIFHNLDVKDDRLTLRRNIAKYLFQSLIGALIEHSTPVLRVLVGAQKPRRALDAAIFRAIGRLSSLAPAGEKRSRNRSSCFGFMA